MERKDYIEVDLSAIAHNTRVMREHLSPDTALMAVVKADAYGHGAVPVAKTALASGASALAVAIPEEGEQLRAAGIDAPILILGGIEPDAAEAVVRNRLIQTLFDTRTLDALSQAAGRLGLPAQVHIKLDTGMSRIGVRDEPGVRALTRAAMAAPGVVLCCAARLPISLRPMRTTRQASRRRRRRSRALSGCARSFGRKRRRRS